MRYIILAFLASCAVAPAESTTEQRVCRRDPVSGRCPTLTADDAGVLSTAWVQTNYTDPLTLDLTCRRVLGLDGKLQGFECEIAFESNGNWHQAGCTVWLTGDVDCGEEDQ